MEYNQAVIREIFESIPTVRPLNSEESEILLRNAQIESQIHKIAQKYGLIDTLRNEHDRIMSEVTTLKSKLRQKTHELRNMEETIRGISERGQQKLEGYLLNIKQEIVELETQLTQTQRDLEDIREKRERAVQDYNLEVEPLKSQLVNIPQNLYGLTPVSIDDQHAYITEKIEEYNEWAKSASVWRPKLLEMSSLIIQLYNAKFGERFGRYILSSNCCLRK